MRRANVVFAAFLVVLGVGFLAGTRGLPYRQAAAIGPGFVPGFLGLILAGIGVAVAYQEATRREGRPEDPGFLQPGSAGRVLLFLGLCAAAAGLFSLAGWAVACFAFVVAELVAIERMPVVRSIVAGLGFTLAIWLVFERWLDIGLPRGPLGL